jgi:hypothetical protein
MFIRETRGGLGSFLSHTKPDQAKPMRKNGMPSWFDFVSSCEIFLEERILPQGHRIRAGSSGFPFLPSVQRLGTFVTSAKPFVSFV